ncbi:MAG: hypothetical protein IJZ49_00345 [Alistipes sp.]|nr:hypothetical protein [Alistipes sp.]
MASLKVLMMGGRRCGKTSVLSSLFDQMIHTQQLNNILTVSDKTILETKEIYGAKEKQESLSNKRLELQSFLSTYKASDFLIDKGPTIHFWSYNMQISLAGTNKTMNIEFRDSAGEFFDHGGHHTQETLDYLKDCDVFVIVVDSPYLMQNDAIADAANVADSIHSFITSIDEYSEDKQGAKLVLFVPMKCERWIQEGKIEDVKNRIFERYASTISHLQKRDNTEVSIIPVQTAGNIAFSEMRTAYTVTTATGSVVKCSKVTDKIVIKSNGDMYSLREGDILNPDAEAVFEFDDESLDIVRPSAWFHHTNPTPKYAPKHCEQVALHILRFMFNKARNNQSTSWFSQFFNRIFGRITLNDLNNTIVELTNSGLIKDTGDGIERIKVYR